MIANFELWSILVFSWHYDNMADFFEIPLTYKGKDLSFPATLITIGYMYKIQVDVFGKFVNFAPDEERNFRAVLSMNHMHDSDTIDKDLLRQIATTLEALFRVG